MSRIPTRLKLPFLIWILAAPATLRAEQQTDIAEIIRALDAVSFWSNPPITVRYTQKVEMYGGATESNVSVSNGEGVLRKDGFTAMTLLDLSKTPSVDDTVPLRKFFMSSNDYTMSYFLYPRNATSKGTQSPKKPAGLGEATIGLPACNCTEKFWSFPMTPSVVARKLEALKEATCDPTNLNGESFVKVVGKSDDEKVGMWWHILFKKTSTTWLPVKTEVYFQNQLLSTIEAFFNPGADYSLDKIQQTLFRGNKVIGLIRWSDITAMPGDQSGGRFSGMDTIPSGVIVTDYRFNKPAIYVMEDSKNTTTVSQRRMIRMDGSDRKNAPENKVQLLLVQVLLFALLLIPMSWLILKVIRCKLASPDKSHV